MQLPSEITDYTSALVQTVRTRDKHYLVPRERVALYRMLKAHTTLHVQEWLSILAAEKVLPIFERHLPDERAPRTALHLSRYIVRGFIELDSWRVTEYMNYVHTASGSNWGYNFSAYFPAGVILSGLAAVVAFVDATNDDPDYLPIREVYDEDEEILGTYSSDAAASSAYAWACKHLDISTGEVTFERTHNADKLLEFWEWWLLEAVPQAWDLAHKYA